MTIKSLFKGLYKHCECGCKELIPIINKRGEFARFKNGHNANGSNHYNWKGGRVKQGDYWKLWMPDYYRADKEGYVREHIYFYEQYHNCCVLSWTEVHHIDPVRKDYCNNMPWNLQGLLKREHRIFHNKGNKYCLGKHVDTSDRSCFTCGSSETYTKQPTEKSRHKTPSPQWQHLPWDQNNWYCRKCCRRLKKKKLLTHSP